MKNQASGWTRSGEYEDILYDTWDGIARITINRPEVRNAFRPTTVFEMSRAFEAAREGFLPGGLKNNRDFVGDCVNFAETVPQEFRDLLFDPQTSGGLLISISPQFADAAIATLDRHGVSARRVGHVVAKKNPLLFVQ